MSDAKKNQISFLTSGLFATGMGIFLNYEAIFKGEFPNYIILLALGLNQLMLAYLSPHIFPKDERAKEIMGKAMTVNYFVLFGTISVLFLLTSSLGPLTLSSTQALSVLFCIMALTIPGTMILYSKRV